MHSKRFAFFFNNKVFDNFNQTHVTLIIFCFLTFVIFAAIAAALSNFCYYVLNPLLYYTFAFTLLLS